MRKSSLATKAVHVLFLATLAGLIWLGWVLTHFGEEGEPPPEPILVVRNETGATLIVSNVILDAESAASLLQPHGSAQLECSMGTLVARTGDGDEVARREPDPTSATPWIIDPPAPAAPKTIDG